jgi:hypothetical protein
MSRDHGEPDVAEYVSRHAPELNEKEVVAFLNQHDKPEQERGFHVEWAVRALRERREGEQRGGLPRCVATTRGSYPQETKDAGARGSWPAAIADGRYAPEAVWRLPAERASARRGRPPRALGDTACPPRLRRLGQEPVDELEGWAALEHGQDVGPVEDQRQARRDHEVRNVQLRSPEDPVGDPGVDSVEHRWELGQELALSRRAGGKDPAEDPRDDQAPREGAPIEEIP